ncbi:MAG: S9 family peptidase [Cytophagales bacterium]|nr:S9 family peptidase [Cytophagales bacterium]MDW8384397.1 DPP IV N-terminal domain-containing protein [Flammeovirgaceae bacterium]
MKNRQCYYLFALIIILQQSYGQPKTPTSRVSEKVLTIEQATFGMATGELAPENLEQIQWISANDDYAYVKNDTLYKGNIKGDDKPILTINTLAEKMVNRKNKPSSFPSITWQTPNSFWFIHDNTLWEYDINKNAFTLELKLPDSASFRDVSPRYDVAQTIKNNLWIIRKTELVAVSQESNPAILVGQATHRYEFGIRKGTFWSPSGKLLAFYRTDESMVTEYPILDFSVRPPKTNTIRYPFAGGKSHEVTIGIYNLENKQTTYLRTGTPKEQYLTNITWDPTEQFIYVAVVDRSQRIMQWRKYNTTTGEQVASFLEEKSIKYIEPENGLFFFPKTKNKFLYLSEKTNFQHLYVSDTEGKTSEQLTSGGWEVTEVLGIDPSEKFVYFISTQDAPIERQIYKIDLKTKQLTKISSDKGVHQGWLSPSGKYLIDSYSNLDVPKRIRIIDLATNQPIKTLLNSRNPLLNYKIGKIEINRLKAQDGTMLYYRIIKPLDFDVSKKYPMLVYVYGGPHVQLIREEWMGGADLFLFFLAQNGYIIFTVDGRGSQYRGLEFEQKIVGNLGEIEMADQLSGVEFMKKQPYINPNRIGVWGWSYGGYLTLSLMTKKPNVFKTGIAGAPVTDWQLYEIMYTERYMSTPEKNQDGYYKANLLNFVKDLNGNLLIVHGTHDDTVVLQHSLDFIRECIKYQKMVDFLLYPEQGHQFRGDARLHINRKILDYFNKNLI